MSLFRQGILVVAVAALGAGVAWWSGLVSLPGPEINPEAGEWTLSQAQAREVLWVDSRSAADYARNHLPEAIHFPEDSWEEGLIRLMEHWLPNPRPVVIYCASPECGTSRRMAQRLREEVPEMEVYSLYGGWRGPVP